MKSEIALPCEGPLEMTAGGNVFEMVHSEVDHVLILQMGKIYWTGICSKERNQAITQIGMIINRHGFFSDFKLFSDVSLSMIIEIEERKVDALYEELADYLALDDFPAVHSNSAKERTILLHVTFTRGTGNLEREVPAVPG